MNRTDFPWNQNYMQSPIMGKYYLQFNNNYLIDIIKHAVRDIIIYDASLPELVISQLQKEIFLIYDNTNIKSYEVEHLIREEFRNATKFQKKLLDMTYTQMEKDKDSISDMRQDGNPWLQSFRLYKMEASELSRKSYGIIASMFLNSFVKICNALNQVANLVNLLIQQSILPPLKMEDMSQRFVNLILTEFNESPFQAGGPNISNVITCMTQEFKRTFVTCHNKGQDIRRRFCRYDSHVDSALMDLFIEPQITFPPMFDLKQQGFVVPERKLEMSNMMDRMLFGSHESDVLKEKTLKKAQDKEYKMLRQFARFWKGYDDNEEDQDAIYEQLKKKHEEFLKYLDQKQKERVEKPKLENQIQSKSSPQTQKEVISQKFLNRILIESKQFDSSKSQNKVEGKQKQENKIIQSLPKSLKTQNQTVLGSKKQQKIEKQQNQHEVKLLKILQSQPAEATFTQKSSQKHSKIQICSKSIQITNQPSKQQNKQTSRPVLNNEKIHTICRQHKMIKKTGKQVSNKQREQFKLTQILQLSSKQTTSRYECDESIIKLRLTKDELRKLQKKKQITQIGRISANDVNTRQFKLVSQTNYNNEQISKYYFQSDKTKTKVQIRNTILSSELQKNYPIGKGFIQKLTKYKMYQCSDDEDQLYTFTSQNVSEKAPNINQLFKNDEEKDLETQQNKKKKKNKNKKKKNKKVEQSDVSELKLQKNMSSVSSKKQESAFIVQKTQEEKNLLSFMDSLKIDDKDRNQCFLGDQYLKKWKIKMQKWKSNLPS